MKTAIVFYSMSGNVKQTAEIIAQMVQADLIEISPVKAFPDKGFKKFFWGGKSAVMGEKPVLQSYEFKSEEYDSVIIGSPVWASNIAPPVRTFVEENKTALSGKKISAFTCMSGSGGDKALNKLKTLLGISDYTAEMVLIDPKDKPTDENDKKISEFCDNL